MRELNSKVITDNIKEMCIEANLTLSEDMCQAIDSAAKVEESPQGKLVFGQLMENLRIAGEDKIPICQDTGMAVVFIEVGQDVHIEGCLEDAINEGVRQGYVEGYLRKSVVRHP
ncbi:MAG: fumarate hydratase, partial [Lachnospiraceae bacterium]|nr:fumarate hydratase [Lachnospiraceae bacterium]